MIVKWKSDGPERFVTEWRGMRLTLQRVGAVPPWALTVAAEHPSDVLDVNGATELMMTNRWATSRHAMSDVDTVMENVVLQLAAQGVTARQRPYVIQGAKTGRHYGGPANFVEVEHAY